MKWKYRLKRQRRGLVARVAGQWRHLSLQDQEDMEHDRWSHLLKTSTSSTRYSPGDAEMMFILHSLFGTTALEEL